MAKYKRHLDIIKKHMIKYNGLKIIGKVHYIMFANEHNNVVEIPIAKTEYDRISIYLDRISTIDHKLVEHGNDELSE